MRIIKEQRFKTLHFDLLSSFPHLIHAVFLDFPLGEKDDSAHFQLALSHLGFAKGVKLLQVHKNTILHFKKEEVIDFNKGYDGVITQEKGVGLLIRHADCQGAFFYDPIHEVIGAAHCGWRGSVLNIYKKMVVEMEAFYRTNPQDLRVCIGPSLGPYNAEFKNFKQEFPKSLWPFQERPNYFNFWDISTSQLLEAGVLISQIEIAKICTYEEGFSYRRDPMTPHHGSIIGLSNKGDEG